MAQRGGKWRLDPYDLWNLDTAIADDTICVLALAREGKYPDSLGFEREIGQVWRRWRG